MVVCARWFSGLFYKWNIMTLSENELAEIKDELRRCSPETLAAAIRFREQGDQTAIANVVYGLIELYQPATAKLPLKDANDDTRLSEDLGLDSLSLLEMVFAIEGVLKIHVESEQLREVRTIGKLNQFLRDKLATVPLSSS
jgi:3-hydroxyacyl-[acyl-carrier-protein] dehydratase